MAKEFGGNSSRGARARIGGFGLALLASTAIYTAAAAFQPAHAQQASTISYSIPAGPLGAAISRFGDRSSLQVLYPAALVQGIASPGVSGTLTREEALDRLLAGTGLAWRFTNANTVTIMDRVAAAHGVPLDADGALVLDTIDVTGGGESSVYSPYETAAPTSHISGENIERFRGSSPADIFRGTPGVMSGESRNGAGSIDPNIRGMQGVGRVQTTIDGAENGLQIYQGYQGVSSRTFVDPDFIAGVDITKGADPASRGIAGTVAMRTLSADDIVKPGDTWGVRVKGGFGTNTSTPNAGAAGGYAWPAGAYEPATVTASPDGLERPGFLSPTSGSGSIVAAMKEENYDIIAGYSYRKQGNYHAGKNGPSANPENIGPQTICTGSWCANWPVYIDNTGIANYRAGEEVLNTQLETHSWLAKATFRFEDDHSLQVGYTGFRGEGGDRISSRLQDDRDQPVQQEQTAGTTLDTGTLRYRWQPADNDLVDLKANLWLTRFEHIHPPRVLTAATPAAIGLPADFRGGSHSVMWGGDVANTSRFEFTEQGSLDLTYGLSYLNEDTRPTRHTTVIDGVQPRDAVRQEAGAFVRAAYKPLDWLTLNAGLRYSHFWSHGRADYSTLGSGEVETKQDEGGFSPSLGLTIEPFEGAQLYANYSSALRLPSLMEAAGGSIFILPNPDLSPERNNSWEVGANLRRDGLFAANDTGMLKLGYFNWDIGNYISRKNENYSLILYNIDKARFSGIEASARYENSGFTAELSGNYYLNVEYCRTSDTCSNASLYSDYATNHIPPRYSVDLTVSQKLFEDRLTLGGRVSHVGPRAAGHEAGNSQFITMVDWKPYTLVDVFAEYKINDNFTASFRVENLTDQYYVDPLSLVAQPGPGRTFYASLTGSFGGEQSLPYFQPPLIRDMNGTGKVDWTGAYAGFHLGMPLGRTWGATTTLDGTADAIAATESANQKLNGLSAGVQGGYNWQFGNGVVLGIQADLSKTDFSGSQKAFATEGALAGTDNLQAETHYNIDWTGSLRGRVGYAAGDRWMIYGTAGLAFAHETQWRDQYRSNTANASNPYGTETGILGVEKASATRLGFTVGGGMEYAINDRWSITGDYSYSRFGTKDFKFETARAGVGRDYTAFEVVGTEVIDIDHPNLGRFCGIVITCPIENPVWGQVPYEGSSSTVNGRKASNSLDFHTFKIGVNYRF